MPRYKLTVEYDGGPYRGFQAQADEPSVQAALERAIQGFTQAFSRVHVAGRTDTGVHATGQVCHFDTEREYRDAVVRDALNAHLVPDPIVVLAAERVADDFHARFQAAGRRYLYRILDRRPPPASEKNRLWWVKTPLDVAAMADAAQVLIGTHDFTTFRDAHCQAKSPLRTLDRVDVQRVGDEVRIAYAARSFLHRQVRSLTGSLVEVGSGRWSKADLAAALDAKDRARCGQVAPPHGLYLTGVDYPRAGARPPPPISTPQAWPLMSMNAHSGSGAGMFKKITDDGAGLSPSPPRRASPALGAGSGMIWLDAAAGDGARRASLTITGSVTGEADIAINTRIVGDVTVTRLTLDEGGVIEGAITAEQVEIRGRVKGNIKAAAVRLCAKAVVEGDITAAKLAIDLGAEFEGAVRRMAAPAPSPRVAEEPAPAMSAKAALEAISIDPARTPAPAAAPESTLVN